MVIDGELRLRRDRERWTPRRAVLVGVGCYTSLGRATTEGSVEARYVDTTGSRRTVGVAEAQVCADIDDAYEDDVWSTTRPEFDELVDYLDALLRDAVGTSLMGREERGSARLDHLGGVLSICRFRGPVDGARGEALTRATPAPVVCPVLVDEPVSEPGFRADERCQRIDSHATKTKPSRTTKPSAPSGPDAQTRS